MANEITVGSEVVLENELVQMLNFFNVMAEGTTIDGFGVVKAVNPTQEQLKGFDKINPVADGNDKVVVFDVKANRHFLIDTPLVRVAQN